MTKTEIGRIGKEKITFCQAESIEDAKKDNIPEGLHFYWEIDGKRVYSPFEVIMRLQAQIAEGNFDAARLIKPDAVQKHYQSLVEKQRNSVVKSLEEYRESSKNILPKEVGQDLNNMINMYKNSPPKPDVDGVMRPNKLQIKEMFGDDAVKQYEQIKEGTK